MTSTPSEQDIRALEDRRFQAMIAADVPTLETLFADDLVYTHSSAVVDTKASLIDAIQSKRSNYQRFERSDELIRHYGDSAVVTGRAIIAGLNAAGPWTLNARYIDVWVNGPRGWQMVAWQTTPIPA